MWGGHPSEQRCRARISLKSWATLLFSECLVPFPGFPTWCEERSPRLKVVEFDDLVELGLSRNCQKIPGGNVPDEEHLVVLRLVLVNALHMAGFQAFFDSSCQVF